MIRHLHTYFSYSILNSSLTLGTFSILTRNVDVYEFGIIGIFLSILYFLVPAVVLNTIGLVGINYTKMNDSDFQRFANNFFSMAILSSIVVFIFCLITIFIFPEYLFSILLIPFIALIITVNSFDDAVSIQKNDSKRHGKHIFISRIGILLLTLLFVFFLKLSWSYYILSILLAEFISLMFRIDNGFSHIKRYQYEFKKEYRIEFFRYGMPLFFLLAAGWSLNNADRFIVLEFFNLESVAMYVAAYQIGMAVNLINQSITNGTVSTIYQSIHDKKDTMLLINKYLKIFAIFYFFIAIVVYITFPVIVPLIFGAQYLDSIGISILIALAFIFNGLYRLPSLVIDFLKKNTLKAWITAVAALLNIILSILLIDFYGLLAPAYGTIYSHIFLIVVVYFASKRLLSK